MKKLDFLFECISDIVVPVILYILGCIIFAIVAYHAFNSVLLNSNFVGIVFLSLIPLIGVVLFVVLKDNIEELKEDYNKYYKNK